jgi:hypothetical protein
MVKYDYVGSSVMIECRIDIFVYSFLFSLFKWWKRRIGSMINSLHMVSGERFPVRIVLPLCQIVSLFASNCASQS